MRTKPPTRNTPLAVAALPTVRRRQHGISLLELMVGMAIGLLVIAVAMVGLMASRSLSGTVSDASLLQQQASFIFRVIGQQVRPAGSLYLNLQQPDASSSKNVATTPVVFETTAAAVSGGNSYTPKTDTLSGTDTQLTVGYRRFKEAVFTQTTVQTLARNCLGGPAVTATDQRFVNVFARNGSDLRCTGNATTQPIAGNVANFQLRYLQASGQNTGSPKVQYVDADTAQADWSRITGVEVCLVLYGNEAIDMPTTPATGEGSSTYLDCDGSEINMTALPAPRTKRMHMVFRNTYQLRSQGVL